MYILENIGELYDEGGRKRKLPKSIVSPNEACMSPEKSNRFAHEWQTRLVLHGIFRAQLTLVKASLLIAVTSPVCENPPTFPFPFERSGN